MNERPANEIRNAWEDVSERLTVWGRLVAARYRESDAGDATATSEGDRTLDATARDLGDQLNRAFTAFGDTLRDDEAKEHLRGAMKAFGDAVSVTVNETAEEIRRRVGSTPHEEPSSETRDDIPPPPASA